MAHNCPKNVNNTNPTIHTNKTTTPPKANILVTPQTTQPSAPSTPTIQLTHTQQIHAIKEAMNNEECSKYLDARNMGQDFWSAGA
jgi:hypothetical protein